ncbi:hypothetical protein [Micromonospora olivasterospora]|uniref:Uncharacterized protein n=1 Tax=Micromonospora olivasterospora TaxID=1880 RepID=A0A562IF67_MICOL|nr:hypothetical protein [Micromonospora olivasterospora]TWH69244.1 hypothetical protein JD77_04252 [Micromonospora olivasterospora]
MQSPPAAAPVAAPPERVTPPAAPPAAGRLARRPRLVGWLAAAWLGPLLAYALGVAAVLPVVVLGLTAALLRGGRTLLDRLVLAGALLLGATCAAGLLFSAWPWGLHPVPVSGTALTVLLGVAAATGRRPRLPRPAPPTCSRSPPRCWPPGRWPGRTCARATSRDGSRTR